MENEEDPNIKLLESLNFQEVKIKFVSSKIIYDYNPKIPCLKINTTIEEIPTSNNIIIDIEKFYDIYIDALSEIGTTRENYEEEGHETTFYFYIAVELDNLISYSVYLKNVESLKNKGITNCFIIFNKFYYDGGDDMDLSLLPDKQKNNIYTIKEIINKYNVPNVNFQFALSYKYIEDDVAELNNDYTSNFNNEYIADFNNNALFLINSPTVINQEIIINKEIIEKKNKKSYDFLLAYFLYHEQKHRNRNKIKNKDIINLLL